MKLRLTERARARSRRNRKVARSMEFRRIESLPRRDWQDETSCLGEVLSIGDEELWELQEAALRECMQVGGLIGAIAVGKGKALISILAGVVMNAKRPILLVPAQLRDQTNAFVLPMAKKNWLLHPNLRIIGYSELSLEKNANLLDRLKPDLIVADEAHALKNQKSGRTRRVARYMRENPETKFVALSGTFSRKSVRDYAHIADWCLKEGSPLPSRWREQNDWADAIDRDVDPKLAVEPGALIRFCDGKENFRDGYRRRLTETRGWIASGEEELGVGLHILNRKIEVVPKIITEALEGLRESWETPTGELITQASELWRFAREIACGFYYRPHETPPVEWVRARKALNRYVNETLKHNRRDLDTKGQVIHECEQMEKPPEEWVTWLAVRDIYKPNPQSHWLHDFVIEDATQWLRDTGGIAWTEQVSVGEALAKKANVPYFGEGKKASLEILTVTGPIVASIHAHSIGKNMQDRYSRNLVLSCPSSGATWEQVLGRTHRPGQNADTVTVEKYVHTAEMVDSFTTAMIDAKQLQQTLGSRQKLCYADFGNVRE